MEPRRDLLRRMALGWLLALAACGGDGAAPGGPRRVASDLADALVAAEVRAGEAPALALGELESDAVRPAVHRVGSARALALPPGLWLDFHLAPPAGAELRADALLPRGAAALEVELAADGEAPRREALSPSSDGVRLLLPGARYLRLSLRVASGAEPLTLVNPRIEGPAGEAADEPRDARPVPVLLYDIDTLRADHLGCYGGEGGLTPHLDAFARDAVVFRAARASSSWTRPAVGSLFTGRYPPEHGATDGLQALPPAAETLAELLGRAGYRTGAVVTNANVSQRFGFQQGFASFDYLREDLSDPRVHQPASLVHERALAFLRAGPAATPVFLYVHPCDPHGPYAPPDDERERFAAGVAAPEVGSFENLRALNRGEVEVTASLTDDLRALYAAEVAYTDAQFGALVAGLRELGLYDRMLLVVTADHGEEFGEHGRFEHGKTLYEEQLRVPLIVKLPGARAGGTERGVAEHVDVLPTVLGELGLALPRGVAGRDLFGPGAERERTQLAFLDHDGHRVRSVVRGDDKLLHTPDEEPAWRLFDLAADPGETRDLAAERPVAAGYLRAALRARMAALAPPAAESVELDPEMEATLRSLGY
ncbi:MAG: sulfatase [Planctomycetota bacterium]